MTKNEIGKLLYKQKPTANLQHISKGGLLYSAVVFPSENEAVTVTFEIPMNDMGDAHFGPKMEAQLLRRWITD